MRRGMWALVAMVGMGCAEDLGETPVLLGSGLPPGLLCVQAVAADDVWFIGSSSEPDDGTGPWVLHYDGATYDRLDLSDWPGAELWWGDVFPNELILVGNEGLILEGTRSGEFEAVEGPSAETNFFGVWGATPDDVWAVGSEGSDRDTVPVIWRRQGGTWSEVDPGVAIGDFLFKVDGTTADDVWFVGGQGTAMHYDGEDFVTYETPVPSAPLLTVAAGGERPIAVGGTGNGLILEFDGEAWIDVSPDFQPGFNGVCTGEGQAWAVGQRGARAERVDGVWLSDDELDIDPIIFDDWHGCSIDPQGGLWMVGGDIASRPLSQGVIGFEGDPLPVDVDSSTLQ